MISPHRNQAHPRGRPEKVIYHSQPRTSEYQEYLGTAACLAVPVNLRHCSRCKTNFVTVYFCTYVKNWEIQGKIVYLWDYNHFLLFLNLLRPDFLNISKHVLTSRLQTPTKNYLDVISSSYLNIYPANYRQWFPAGVPDQCTYVDYCSAQQQHSSRLVLTPFYSYERGKNSSTKIGLNVTISIVQPGGQSGPEALTFMYILGLAGPRQGKDIFCFYFVCFQLRQYN